MGFLTDSLMATITVAGGIWFLQHYKEFVNPTGGQPSLTLSSLLSPPTRGPPTEGGPSLPQEIQRAMQSASPQNLGNLPSEQGKHKAVNHGGTVMAHTKLWFIFWGHEWDQSSANKQMKTRINDAMQRLFASSYFDGLAQYGVSKPTIGGIVSNLTYPVPDGTDIAWQEVPNVVLDSVKRQQVPDPDTTAPLANYYFVWVPPGHAVPGYGGLSLYSKTPAKGTLFYWSGVVYPSVPHPLIPDILDNITQAFSHECVDALTNGREQPAWVLEPCTEIPGDNHSFAWDPKGCAIAQWCGHILKKSPATGNVMVEAYFSNKDNRCIIPGTPLFTGDAKY